MAVSKDGRSFDMADGSSSGSETLPWLEAPADAPAWVAWIDNWRLVPELKRTTVIPEGGSAAVSAIAFVEITDSDRFTFALSRMSLDWRRHIWSSGMYSWVDVREEVLRHAREVAANGTPYETGSGANGGPGGPGEKDIDDLVDRFEKSVSSIRKFLAPRKLPRRYQKNECIWDNIRIQIEFPTLNSLAGMGGLQMVFHRPLCSLYFALPKWVRTVHNNCPKAICVPGLY